MCILCKPCRSHEAFLNLFARPNSFPRKAHPLSSHELHELKYGEVAAAGYTTAVFPISACEPHNYHLPYGTDYYLVNHVATNATRKANAAGGKVVCLPPLHFGYEGNMREFPLAINLQPSTLISIVRDISQSLVDGGVKFLFILNGHGGNELKTIVRELNRDVDDLFICGANWWESAADVIKRECPAGGDHANDWETAGLLHIVPELVDMSLADPGHMTEPLIPEFAEGWVKYSRHWMSYAPSSGAGDPRAATAEGGAAIMNAAIDRIGAFLAKLSNAERKVGFPFAK